MFVSFAEDDIDGVDVAVQKPPPGAFIEAADWENWRAMQLRHPGDRLLLEDKRPNGPSTTGSFGPAREVRTYHIAR
jgi:hypothetical protein